MSAASSRSIASTATLEALELGVFRRLLEREAVSDAGRAAIADLTPSADAKDLAAKFCRGREVEALLEDGALVPSFDDEILPLLERLENERGSLLGPDLLALRFLLRTTTAALARIEDAEPPGPGLTELARAQPEAADLETALERVLDDRGGVREDASPALVAAARQARRSRQAVYSQLERYVREHSEHLAEETMPLHAGRLVLLLRSGAKGKLRGLVHGRSATGKSLYFEPMDAVEGNNRLQEALAAQEEERRRLLEELIEKLFQGRERLRARTELLAELDLRQAAVRWGRRAGAEWIEPGAERALELLEARHPLLDPELASLRRRALGQAGHTGEVVPLTLRLDADERVLVVTGPNAGGKTVALKTAGLLVVLAHCGLPIPAAAGSRVPRLERVVATVGDDQDLLADRSTFSGRLLRLQEAWAGAGPDSLVLLDELGSGTDPEEGAALAVALLEELVRGRALAVLTSHLTPLAAAALDLDGAGCAAMEFDPASGEPTFELVPGPPGSSEAIALARRLGLPDRWLSRAEELLGPGHRRMQDLLREVETLRDELATERRETRRRRRELDAELELAGTEREELERQRTALDRDLRARLEEFRQQVTTELRTEYKRLREELAAGRKKGLVGKAVDRLFEEAPVPPRPASATGPIEVGASVRHASLGWVGEVGKVDGKRVEVLVGGKRLRCRLDDLETVAAPPPASSLKPAKARKASLDLDEPAEPGEIHLRGERVEEALERLDGYLDRALLAGSSEVRVVHGHGTGRLKKAVRSHLKNHPAVAGWRPGGRGEGGDGATVVTLAG